MGLAMMVASGDWIRPLGMTQTIGREVLSVRDPVALSELAAGRKPYDDAAALRHPDRRRHDLLPRLDGDSLLNRRSSTAIRRYASSPATEHADAPGTRRAESECRR